MRLIVNPYGKHDGPRKPNPSAGSPARPQVIPALIQPAGLEEIFRRVNFIEGVESYIQVRAFLAARQRIRECYSVCLFGLSLPTASSSLSSYVPCTHASGLHPCAPCRPCRLPLDCPAESLTLHPRVPPPIPPPCPVPCPPRTWATPSSWTLFV